LSPHKPKYFVEIFLGRVHASQNTIVNQKFKSIGVVDLIREDLGQFINID